MKDILALRERAKELRCLYAIDGVISDREQPPTSAFLRVLQEVPAGWRHSDTTGARVIYLGRSYVGPGFVSDRQIMSESIRLWGVEVGRIDVSDTIREDPPYLPEEAELLGRIAGRLGEYLEWKHTELLGERTSARRNHWAWRQRFAEALADKIDSKRFGVSRAFIGGSTARGDAGPSSDIDLYITFRGSVAQKENLSAWLEGWSLCLGEVALQQTGQPFPEGILNVQWLDEDPGVWQQAELEELRLGESKSASKARRGAHGST